MIQGCDVHAGYGRIDWGAASKVVRFCWAKCTEGNKDYIDEQFASNVAGCKANGVPVGSYHFAFPLPDHKDHPGRSPEEQVERAFAGCKGLGSKPGELAHMLDAEWPAPEDAERKWGCTRPQISMWLKRYCELATQRWVRKPVIYTYPYWWRWLAAGADVSWAPEYELVFADYGHPGPGMPPDGWVPPHMSWVSATWRDWAVCQYSADGSKERIPGINACPVDRDCIRDEPTLRRLANLDVVPAPDPEDDRIVVPDDIRQSTLRLLVDDATSEYRRQRDEESS